MGKYLEMLSTLKKSQGANQAPELTELRSDCFFKTSRVGPELTEKRLNSVFSGTYVGICNIFSQFQKEESTQELELLPDTLKWLENILYWKQTSEKVALLREYQRIWLSAMEDEPSLINKQNAGQFKANTWLRNTLKDRKSYE